MCMYCEIDWSQKDNEEICKRKSSSVAEYATDLLKAIGHSSDLDVKKNGMLRSPVNQMVYGQGAEEMFFFAESGHPIF